MKKTMGMLLAAILAVGIAQSDVCAFQGGDGPGKGWQKKSKAERLFKGMKFIHRFKDELKVTDEQLTKFNEIKTSFKKDAIMKRAEIAVIGVDIKTAMQDEEIDAAAVNALIDKKYALKKDQAKRRVAAVAAMKQVLSQDQKDQLKILVKEHVSEYKNRRHKRDKGPDCPMESGQHGKLRNRE